MAIGDKLQSKNDVKIAMNKMAESLHEINNAFQAVWSKATIITKTVIVYFGIKSTEQERAEGKTYVILAMLFTFCSLIFFAIRKSRTKND